jgi:hypothetical protein
MLRKIFLPLLVIFTAPRLQSQTNIGKLTFEKGQRFEILLDIKSKIVQQAMGQTIDFTANANTHHSYKVTNATEDNTTLNHQIDTITFNFDGWGQKVKFNSANEKDMKSMFGKPMKDVLDKRFSIIIDPTGNTLMAIPEKIKLADMDSRMALFASLLKDVTDLVQPPAKGSASFFKILPASETATGSNWTESTESENNKAETTYTLAAITDSTIVIHFTGISTTTGKAEMMGQEMTTTMNNKHTGKIIADKVTGIIKEKTIKTESSGTTEGAFGSVPVTSNTTTIITVRPGL